ncbi:MAG: hypothetical protein ACRDRK_25720 [Pseudonocardia sp.]
MGWITAISAGVAEALVRLVLPDPPTSSRLAVRFAIYVVLAVLVSALLTGRSTIGRVVAVVLGGVGMVSLVMEPLSWVLGGGLPTAYLAAADGSTPLVVGLRVVYVGAVLAALVLMLRPAAKAVFRTAAGGRVA